MGRIIGLAALITVLAGLSLYFIEVAYCGSFQNIASNTVQGLFVSILVVLALEFIKEYHLSRRLKHLVGDWHEHNISDAAIAERLGQGHVEYNGGNSLVFTLEHDGRKWSGEAIMNASYPHYGRLTWAYQPDANIKHEFGLKEVIIPTELNKEDEEFDYLYLIPVNHAHGLSGRMDLKTGNVLLNQFGYGKVVWRRAKGI